MRFPSKFSSSLRCAHHPTIRAIANKGVNISCGRPIISYTISDPRAILLKELARDLAKEKGKEEEFAFLELLEERAIAMFGKIKNNGKTVSSNIDFYSGFVYEMIGLPQEIFTPLFAMARSSNNSRKANSSSLPFSFAKSRANSFNKNVLEELEYVPLKQR